MIKKNCLVLLFIMGTPFLIYAQKNIPGQVFDSVTKETLPFVTIKFGDSGHGTVASLEGKFEIPAAYADTVSWIEISHLGYRSKKITLPLHNPNIYLQPENRALNEVVVKPPYEKMRRIINNAIDNKNKNNPDKYNWYRCHLYYKMIADVSLPDSLMKDTTRISRETADFINDQHMLMSETYSIRTWRKPQHLQEDVLASRISGFKKSLFTSLVTDVVPFHAYYDYITLNGTDYHNPVSKGFESYYKFNLNDEVIDGNDTVWILSFMPKKSKANILSGTVYINSNGYAISQIIAKAYDTMLDMGVRIEQQYRQVPFAGNEARWFPEHLNYIVDWKQKSGKSYTTLHMKGYSRIDSVTWQEDENFHFDKTHTVKLATKADEVSAADWNTIRPEKLDAKEIRTYRVIDSFGDKIHLDRYVAYLSKLPEAKVPVGIFDFDMKRLFTYNYHENVRLGLGAQTNEQLVKWLSVGGWAGYGFLDGKWKYGVFGEIYAGPHKEFVIRGGYTDDLNDPGRVHINHDLDKNYLNYYLLRLVDETKTYTASVKKKIGYWSFELSVRQQQIIPLYQYALEYDGTAHTIFTANEASLSFRYAYAERTAPLFNYYYSLGSRYPIWYGKITTGSLESSNNYQTPYTQALTAVLWNKHINRVGFEHFQLEGGNSWSNEPLPLGKLFAANGYKYDVKGDIQESIYTFGGFMTIYPYQFYTDRFVSFIYRHDFDWKLYKLQFNHTKLSSAPNIALQYDMLYGTLKNQQAQEFVSISVPGNAYQEAGLMLNNLLRLVYVNTFYLTLNIGYFYHLATTPFDSKQNGRFVYGAGFEF